MCELLFIGSLKPNQIPIKYNQVNQRTAQALNVGLSTVKRVLHEFDESGSVQPSKKSKKGRRSIRLDSFDEGVVRRAILAMYSNKTFPTLDNLHAQLQQDENFSKLSKSALWRCYKNN